ncbi:hypothetical protein PVAP13_5NG643500 [Panicum virgatum]|uniref:Uncharacterized protein n=1 Tax=Panicum virgatum TaxID=38727 RepID=A0A8T0S5S2_PANVG|nr:hypothetical protein PVAP13_5NG643500 [Panicum virgatum]
MTWPSAPSTPTSAKVATSAFSSPTSKKVMASAPSTPTLAQVAASPASAPSPTPAGATTASVVGSNARSPAAPSPTTSTTSGAVGHAVGNHMNGVSPSPSSPTISAPSSPPSTNDAFPASFAARDTSTSRGSQKVFDGMCQPATSVLHVTCFHDAVQAYKALHGHCILDGCCRLDVQHVLYMDCGKQCTRGVRQSA